MFDTPMRRVKEMTHSPFARYFGRFSPMTFTMLSLLMGVVTFGLLWQQQYWLALVAWFLNRFFDGVDGTLARMFNKQSDFGGYVDIMVDFVGYALIPFGLVLGQPSELSWIMLTVLLSSFYVNAASWMYLSALLEKRSLGASSHGEETSVTMPGGLVGGFVTIVFYSAFIILAPLHQWLFGIMSVLVLIGVVQRLVWAREVL